MACHRESFLNDFSQSQIYRVLIFYGRGQLKFWGFYEFIYPRKTPNFGDLLWFIPKKPQILGLGMGLQLKKKIGGYFEDGETPNFGDIWGNKTKDWALVHEREFSVF